MSGLVALEVLILFAVGKQVVSTDSAMMVLLHVPGWQLVWALASISSMRRRAAHSKRCG